MISTSTIDYRASAELFISKGQKPGRQPMRYLRFTTAAEAIQFAIEELSADLVPGTVLQVGEARFAHAEIRGLYDSSGYPLPRASA